MYRAEFEQHGLSEIIQLRHQNVYKDGFELVDTVDSGSSSSRPLCELY